MIIGKEMTDLHTHILPCIDDGARTIEFAIQMLEKEIEQGVKTVVFTPHYYGQKHSPQQFLERREKSYEMLKNAVAGMDITVRLGAEVYISSQEIASSQDLEQLAIEGTNYILIELPLTSVWSKALFQRLAEFIEKIDKIPIVAHVERYAEIKKHPEYLNLLANMGCLLQMNTSAFIDERTRKFAFLLVDKGLSHCLATDCHDLIHRPCDYKTAKSIFEENGKGAEFDRLQENMSVILQGGIVKTLTPAPIKRFFGKYF